MLDNLRQSVINESVKMIQQNEIDTTGFIDS